MNTTRASLKFLSGLSRRSGLVEFIKFSLGRDRVTGNSSLPSLPTPSHHYNHSSVSHSPLVLPRSLSICFSFAIVDHPPRVRTLAMTGRCLHFCSGPGLLLSRLVSSCIFIFLVSRPGQRFVDKNLPISATAQGGSKILR